MSVWLPLHFTRLDEVLWDRSYYCFPSSLAFLFLFFQWLNLLFRCFASYSLVQHKYFRLIQTRFFKRSLFWWMPSAASSQTVPAVFSLVCRSVLFSSLLFPSLAFFCVTFYVFLSVLCYHLSSFSLLVFPILSFRFLFLMLFQLSLTLHFFSFQHALFLISFLPLCSFFIHSLIHTYSVLFFAVSFSHRFQGRCIEHSYSLRHYNIQDGSSVHFVFRLRSPAVSSSVATASRSPGTYSCAFLANPFIRSNPWTVAIASANLDAIRLLLQQQQPEALSSSVVNQFDLLSRCPLMYCHNAAALDFILISSRNPFHLCLTDSLGRDLFNYCLGMIDCDSIVIPSSAERSKLISVFEIHHVPILKSPDAINTALNFAIQYHDIELYQFVVSFLPAARRSCFLFETLPYELHAYKPPAFSKYFHLLDILLRTVLRPIETVAIGLLDSVVHEDSTVSSSSAASSFSSPSSPLSASSPSTDNSFNLISSLATADSALQLWTYVVSDRRLDSELFVAQFYEWLARSSECGKDFDRLVNFVYASGTDPFFIVFWYSRFLHVPSIPSHHPSKFLTLARQHLFPRIQQLWSYLACWDVIQSSDRFPHLVARFVPLPHQSRSQHLTTLISEFSQLFDSAVALGTTTLRFDVRRDPREVEEICMEQMNLDRDIPHIIARFASDSSFW